MSEKGLDPEMQRVLLAAALETEREVNLLRQRLERLERTVFGETNEDATDGDEAID